MLKKIDDLGRIVIPKEYRDRLNLQPNNDVVISYKDNALIIKKHNYSINYEEFIRTLLIIKKGMEYKNYFITKENITSLDDLLDKYINNQFKNIDKY
ncbi:MAG: AbrB/MazE/SpoVT family DNA-binding domain-containing protein [bacterium]|nr:AbrB/MazE/SpoVT family DNA-binding domain-containing protein [bacterium]